MRNSIQMYKNPTVSTDMDDSDKLKTKKINYNRVSTKATTLSCETNGIKNSELPQIHLISSTLNAGNNKFSKTNQNYINHKKIDDS